MEEAVVMTGKNVNSLLSTWISFVRKNSNKGLKQKSAWRPEWRIDLLTSSLCMNLQNKKNKTINFLKLPMVYVLPYGLLKRKQTMKTFGGMVFGDETIPRKKCGHVTLCGYLNK
ncbi:hypothetical protein LXL04_014611 [Taraxacum kok-saghyz]